MKFHDNVTTFNLDPDELLHSLFLGPLQPNIRTRLAAVHSSTRLRMFSTDSERVCLNMYFEEGVCNGQV
jgi:hypothetical protein